MPKNRAYSDQASAASVPTLMSVSIVAAPPRRFFQAARWNGQAPHRTTGAASVRASHCQARNCSAGTIDIAMTGTVRAVTSSSRSRSARTWSGSPAPSTSPSPGAPSLPAGRTGSGSRAA